MLLFTMLPLAVAANAYLLFHIAVAGFATYALARALGLRPIAALVAASAYELAGPVYDRSVCCPAQVQVATWMPLLLLGAELALRRAAWPARARWWGLAGLALSQILASWLGQVAYYALLVLGCYLVYRTLIDPVRDRAGGFRPRAMALLINGVAIFAIGFGLAAAGMLPRLEYNRLSNVAGGVYGGEQSYAAVVGGWTANASGLRDLSTSLYYPGGAVLALALMALVLAHRRYAVPFFLFLSCAAMILASHRQTPLHSLLYRLLPHFAELHRHYPERVTIVTYLAPAILAGAAVDALPTWVRRRRSFIAAAVPITVIAAAAVRWPARLAIPWQPLAAALGVIAIVMAGSRLRSPRLTRLAPTALLLIVALDLLIAGPRIMAAAPYGGFHRLDLGAYYAADGAVRFLQQRQADQPVRFFGYDPALRSSKDGKEILYRDQFAQPESAALIVNNRATLFGLQDVQGYNPVQLKRFVEFLNAINGHTQDYHDADVFLEGLGSPLLDLLNVRYIVIPVDVPADRVDLTNLLETYPVVYRDADVQILDRTTALPRAWLVHDARQVEPGAALSLLTSGAVDPRQTALVETRPPGLVRPVGAATDRVRVVAYAPEQIKLTVSTAAAGLLVLSEVSYPGWEVFVDGEPAKPYVVDHLLRGVAVQAGEHTVEWRYHSDAITLGLAVTLTSIACVAALCTGPLLRRRPAARTRPRPVLSPLAPLA
jgi:hypothetical protein